MKEMLAAIWKLGFRSRSATLENVSGELAVCTTEEVKDRLVQFVEEGLVDYNESSCVLTEKGRAKIKVVVCGGVFDILHPGHAFILEQAKACGDVLVVVVARDSTVKRRKRIPIVPEEQRMEMVSKLKPVDLALLGYEGDYLKIIEEVRPDIIALGPDQHHDEKRIREETAKRGLNLEVVRIKKYRECQLNSTKAILQRIIERNYPDSRSGG